MVTLFIILFLTLYLCAFIVAMFRIGEAAEDKGYDDAVIKLWFVGLVCSPILPAAIVAALPEKKAKGKGAAIEDELPSI